MKKIIIRYFTILKRENILPSLEIPNPLQSLFTDDDPNTISTKLDEDLNNIVNNKSHPAKIYNKLTLEQAS